MSVAYLRYERCTSLSNGRFSKKTRRSILQGGVPDPATGSLSGRVGKKNTTRRMLALRAAESGTF